MISLERAGLTEPEAGVDLGGRVGNESCRPIFIGETKPALGVLEVDHLLFDVGVFLFLHLVGKHADEAFVTDQIALKLWSAVARDQAERVQSNRRRTLV